MKLGNPFSRERLKRILILGNCGSGKTTLGRRLGDLLGLPVVHLDRHYWQPGWKEPAPDIWRQKVAELAAGEAWVMDGNYYRSLDLRLPRADTVLYLDYPTWLCLLRVYQRYFHYRGKQRPDIGEGCPEKMDREFLHWIWSFRQKVKPVILTQIAAAGREDATRYFTRSAQVERFLDSLQTVNQSVRP